MKKLILIIVVIFSCYNLTFAQDQAKPDMAKSDKTKTDEAKTEPFNKWEIGVNGGVGNFAREYDLHKWTSYADWDSQLAFGFGAFVKKNFSHVFALELGWNNNTLNGSVYHGFYPPYPSTSFKTVTNEFDLNSVWNINNLFAKNKFDRRFYLFAKLGVGATSINNKVGATYSGSTTAFTVPAGGGLGIKLSDKVRINLGTQWSWMPSDRLNGVAVIPSTNNPNPSISGAKLYTYAGISIMLGKKKKQA